MASNDPDRRARAARIGALASARARREQAADRAARAAADALLAGGMARVSLAQARLLREALEASIGACAGGAR